MAPRAYCKGRLKLSLVFCATKLHPDTSSERTSSERVRFPPSHHQHRGCAEARSPSRDRSASGAAKVCGPPIAARALANRQERSVASDGSRSIPPDAVCHGPWQAI
jgi:hypothetical protein